MSSLQLTEDPDRVRSFGGYNTLIVSISRHDARKGVDVLLRALGKLHKGGLRFRACLVGGGPLLKQHRRLATQLGLSDNTHITGWVSDPIQYLRHADVFVLPSVQEGSGSLSLIEALQPGVAVVASRIDGIPEDVVHNDSALLVRLGDVCQLCESLAKVIINSALRRRLQQRSRETFLEKFSPELFTSALHETYTKLGFPGA